MRGMKGTKFPNPIRTSHPFKPRAPDLHRKTGNKDLVDPTLQSGAQLVPKWSLKDLSTHETHPKEGPFVTRPFCRVKPLTNPVDLFFDMAKG